jgi:hypothetical protein
MLRRYITAIALALALATSGNALARENPSKALDARLKTSGAFLKAAEKITAEASSKESIAILKLAQESYAEALNHVNTGEYEFASEDLSDATTKAIHAIILATNSDDHSIRDIVMKEEVALLAEREHDRKEARLKKGMAEVEIFIITAERLLKDKPNEQTAARISETREIYKASKEKIAAGDYDGALEGVAKAYQLATSAVKEIKRSQGDMLTFPKAAYTEPKDILAHELKMNDAYAFFAASMIDKGGDGAGKLVSDGLAYRERAIKAIETGGEKEAIDALKASTELLIKALQSAGD